MDEHSEVYVGLDVAKARHAVAVADGERQGEVRYLGEIDADPGVVQRRVTAGVELTLPGQATAA